MKKRDALWLGGVVMIIAALVWAVYAVSPTAAKIGLLFLGGLIVCAVGMREP